ncbi:MAG: imidazole glycerol phosphate synthase subunit HisF [Synergistaceae bacterium]|jgi:cyclase|nr:imidazole glycerol phosphate synthase subunit HisF [Synergistaceae bacterium]
MLKKRIIPCLDVKNGRVVKGINFVNLRDAGDPATLAKTYMEEGADELTFLDITASNERRATMLDWVKVVADAISIPFTVGGGITGAEEAVSVVALGADKISLNTAAVRRGALITECAEALGSQAVVVAVDARRDGGKWRVFIEGGRTLTDLDAYDWCLEAESLGAGELLITSMDRDGTREGYDVEFLKLVSGAVKIPIIASGGAGEMRHALEAFDAGADAALLASLLHFGEIRIRDLKNYLAENGVAMRI